MLSARTHADVERVLPASAPGVTPREAHAALALWSKTTVQHAIGELVALGRVRFEGEMGRRRYWRANP